MRHTNCVAGVCLYLLVSLLASNSYADQVSIEIWNGTYIGQVSNGVPHGRGTWAHPDGHTYVGEWKDGEMNGQGTLTYTIGKTYIGEFKNSKIHGQGTMYYPDGSMYVGEFQNRHRHGQGTLSRAGKVVEDGVWQFDVFTGKTSSSGAVDQEGWCATENQLVFRDSARSCDALGGKIFSELSDANAEMKRMMGQDVWCVYDWEVKRYKKWECLKWSGTPRDSYDWNGGSYTGRISDGVPHGQGNWILPNGERYVGEFKDGKMGGRGTYTFGNGNQYVGQFMDDKYHGHGTFTYGSGANLGDSYVGEHKYGKKSGQGTYTFADGRKYVGQFKYGKANGEGTWTFPDGHVYIGNFKNNEYHGLGTYIFANGNQYVGEFRNGEYHGHGTYTYGSGGKSGESYVGEFEDGKRHGHGTYTYASGGKSGESYVGEWKDDKPWDGVYYLASGKIRGTYSEGEWCEGCQPKSDPKDSGGAIWCATKSSVTYLKSTTQSSEDYCKSRGGKPYTSEDLAKAEHNRLKKAVSSSSTGSWCATPRNVFDLSLFGQSKTAREKHCPSDGKVFSTEAEAEAEHKRMKVAKSEEPATPRELIGTGTGFVVNQNYVVTADHVIKECNTVTIRRNNEDIIAKTIARDARNDLGLLKIGQSIGTIAKLRSGSLRLGEPVSNYGYPLFGQVSTNPTITQGNINNLLGWNNNSNILQFDAPTQPGNSGGPVLDSSGNVVGVAVQILSKKYADITGHIAQNVNFAVKSKVVKNFLSSNSISYETARLTANLTLPEIAEKAEKFTVLVGCWKSTGKKDKRTTVAKFDRPGTVPINATSTLENKYGKYVHYYDPRKWTVIDGHSDYSEFEVLHRNKDGYGMFIFERIQVPMKNFRQAALTRFRQTDPNAQIAQESRRTVNGVEALVLTLTGTHLGIDFIYYGYFVSGKWGTLQVLTYTSANLFDEFKNDFTEFLNGLVITD